MAARSSDPLKGLANTDTVKVKTSHGHEAVVFVESVPAYLDAGWSVVGNHDEIDPDKVKGEGQPTPPPLTDPSEKK